MGLNRKREQYCFFLSRLIAFTSEALQKCQTWQVYVKFCEHISISGAAVFGRLDQHCPILWLIIPVSVQTSILTVGQILPPFGEGNRYGQMEWAYHVLVVCIKKLSREILEQIVPSDGIPA